MPSALRAQVDQLASALPGASLALAVHGELESWKVGGKMFACFGTMQTGVSVKCPDVETASMLIAARVAERAPYFHRSWVRLPETVEAAELRHRLLASYRLVRAGLPVRLRRDLPDPPPEFPEL